MDPNLGKHLLWVFSQREASPLSPRQNSGLSWLTFELLPLFSLEQRGPVEMQCNASHISDFNFLTVTESGRKQVILILIICFNSVYPKYHFNM